MQPMSVRNRNVAGRNGSLGRTGSAKRRALSNASRAVIESMESRRLLANSVWAFPAADGHMIYQPRELGDHVQDYSMVGYMGGTQARSEEHTSELQSLRH